MKPGWQILGHRTAGCWIHCFSCEPWLTNLRLTRTQLVFEARLNIVSRSLDSIRRMRNGFCDFLTGGIHTTGIRVQTFASFASFAVLGMFLGNASNASLGHRRSSQKQCAWYGDSRKGTPQKKLHFAVDFTANHEDWALGYSDLLLFILFIWGTKCQKVFRITWLDRLCLTLATKAPRFEPFKTLRRPWTRLGQSMRSHLIRSSILILMFDESTGTQPNQWWSWEEVMNCFIDGRPLDRQVFVWLETPKCGWTQSNQKAFVFPAIRSHENTRRHAPQTVGSMSHKRSPVRIDHFGCRKSHSQTSTRDNGGSSEGPGKRGWTLIVSQPPRSIQEWRDSFTKPRVAKNRMVTRMSMKGRRKLMMRMTLWRSPKLWCSEGIFSNKSDKGDVLFFLRFEERDVEMLQRAEQRFSPSSATWRDGECLGRFKLCWLK